MAYNMWLEIFLVRWIDGTETWIPLNDMKESKPVEIAEFAKA